MDFSSCMLDQQDFVSTFVKDQFINKLLSQENSEAAWPETKLLAKFKMRQRIFWGIVNRRMS